jgi:hypothetical protein
MYKICTQNSGDDFSNIENEINENNGFLVFVSGNKHRFVFVYEVPDMER